MLLSLRDPCRCHIAMPDDAAAEKSQLLQALGAQVLTCNQSPIMSCASCTNLHHDHCSD